MIVIVELREGLTVALEPLKVLARVQRGEAVVDELVEFRGEYGSLRKLAAFVGDRKIKTTGVMLAHVESGLTIGSVPSFAIARAVIAEVEVLDWEHLAIENALGQRTRALDHGIAVAAAIGRGQALPFPDLPR